MRTALTLKDISTLCTRKQPCWSTVAPTIIKLCSNKNRAVVAALVATVVNLAGQPLSRR